MATRPIVTGTDGSETSLRAVEWAAREATLRGLPLRIVSAAELMPQMIGRQSISDYDIIAGNLRRQRHQALAAAAKRAGEIAPGLVVDLDELTGAPAQAVTESGAGAAMLAVGAHGGGAFSAMLLGSVSRHAATHASCPVVVVREQTSAVHRQIGIGIGSMDDCANSVAFAFEEAALRKASLIAIHVWRDVPAISRSGHGTGSVTGEGHAKRQLADLLSDWKEKYPDITVSQEVVHGHPARVLAGLSARADLVVLGRHARHSILPGPARVTNAVMNHAHSPVITIPPEMTSGEPHETDHRDHQGRG